MKEALLIRHRRKLKLLKPNKWFVNRNTPVGEPADLYEMKPYDGKRYIPSEEIIGFVNLDTQILRLYHPVVLEISDDVREWLDLNNIQYI